MDWPTSFILRTRAWFRAHHVTDVALVGCPDPNPTYTRYFAPHATSCRPTPDAIGRAYIGALSDEVAKWLRLRATDGPIGVCFSGGVDSGSVFLVFIMPCCDSA